MALGDADWTNPKNELSTNQKESMHRSVMVGKRGNMKKQFWIFSACLWVLSFPAFGEDKNAWQAPILTLDTAYWQAFNSAQPAGMNVHLAEDVEFYHDRGGVLIGKAALSKVNNGMKTSESRVRRELIPNTMKLFPMYRGDKLYGAIMTGEHQFFIRLPKKDEQLAGKAFFTHLLLLKKGQWKISRIYSYEHVDAAQAQATLEHKAELRNEPKPESKPDGHSKN